MISICIPVYNFNITILINELTNQLNSLDAQCEIIIIDDGSQSFKAVNKSICEKHTYIELPENIGRSRIRNLFLKYAKNEYLLFLDCDCIVKNHAFVSNYIEIIRQKPSVVCGGRIYDSVRPGREKRLRWKYGILRESQPYLVRREFPNKSFMTNNFLISKSLFEENRFDERILQYGHEDTLFGYSLKKRNVLITHIDNPVINGDVELNEEYIRKTREGIINLVKILNFIEYDDGLIQDISILSFYHRIKKLKKIIYLLFVMFKPLLNFCLKKGFVSLVLFDFYKLGVFIENQRIELLKES